jgi:hypothetical protein
VSSSSKPRGPGGRPKELRDPVRVVVPFERPAVRDLDKLARRFPLVFPSRNHAIRKLVGLALENVDAEHLERLERELTAGAE